MSKIVSVLVKGYWYHGFEINGKLYVNLTKPVGRTGSCMQF